MSGYSSGPVTSTQRTESQRAIDMIRAMDSVYFKAFSMQPEAFAIVAAKEFDVMRSKSTIKQGMTDYAYMQALVRQSGLSKGKGPLNAVDTQDIAAITNVYKNAYLQNVDWQTWLEQYAQSPYASSNAGPKFSKEVSSALQMIDKTDAENILTKSYYEASQLLELVQIALLLFPRVSLLVLDLQSLSRKTLLLSSSRTTIRLQVKKAVVV